MAVFFDLETLDLFDDPHLRGLSRDQQIKQMRIGLAMTYDSRTSQWRTWQPEEIADLWNFLVLADEVVGWNIAGFDIPIVKAEYRRRVGSIKRNEKVEVFDLFDEIRRRTDRWYKLETIAQRNLRRGKSGDGLQAVAWLRSGDPILIKQAEDYCREDVQLVMDLHRILQSGGILYFPARSERGEDGEMQVRLPVATQPSSEKPSWHREPHPLSYTAQQSTFKAVERPVVKPDFKWLDKLDPPPKVEPPKPSYFVRWILWAFLFVAIIFLLISPTMEKKYNANSPRVTTPTSTPIRIFTVTPTPQSTATKTATITPIPTLSPTPTPKQITQSRVVVPKDKKSR